MACGCSPRPAQPPAELALRENNMHANMHACHAMQPCPMMPGARIPRRLPACPDRGGGTGRGGSERLSLSGATLLKRPAIPRAIVWARCATPSLLRPASSTVARRPAGRAVATSVPASRAGAARRRRQTWHGWRVGTGCSPPMPTLGGSGRVSREASTSRVPGSPVNLDLPPAHPRRRRPPAHRRRRVRRATQICAADAMLRGVGLAWRFRDARGRRCVRNAVRVGMRMASGGGATNMHVPRQ
eukprot:354185-Chlamydomonas_euryale.AAC.3